MTSIRKFASITLLALTSLNFAPTLASAEEPAHGKFTLSHDVHWQNVVVPAGDYRFSYGFDGFPRMLVLSKLSGARTGYMLLVPATEEAKPTDLSRLVLRTTPDGTYVTAMQLPESGMTLDFNVPLPTAEKQVATTGTPTLAASR